MMKKYLSSLLFGLLWIKGYAQHDSRLIDGLNAVVRPIMTVNPEDSFNDIRFLKEIAKDAVIIGIGESTHGTAIYDTYRRRLVRFLVQEMGYKAIIDEGDMLAAEKVDDYVSNRTSSLELKGDLRPVTMNRPQLDWLRLYNKSKSDKEQVHIYGAEVRGFYGIIQKLKSLFISNAESPVLEKLSGNIGIGYKNLSKKDFTDIKSLAEKWNTECHNPVCKYYLSALNQEIDFAYRQRFGRNDFNTRDRYMLKNIQAIVSKAPENKAIILAHNGHLQKTKFTTMTSLGYLLNNFFGRKYFVIATDFNKGNVAVYNFKTERYENTFFKDVDDKNAVEYYFRQCKYPNFLLSIKEALDAAMIAPLVNNRIKMLRNMGTSGDLITSRVRLAENYDLIVFFNNASNRIN